MFICEIKICTKIICVGKKVFLNLKRNVYLIENKLKKIRRGIFTVVDQRTSDVTTIPLLKYVKLQSVCHAICPFFCQPRK
jgi:hypothetical protein